MLEEVFPPESEEGATEYKWKLVGVSEERLEELASQMKCRLDEGGGEAFYVLGVRDDGYPVGLSEEEARESLEVLRRVAERLGARIQLVREGEGRRGKVLEVLVRLSREECPPLYITVTALGNVDAGKSTLIGVLCTGALDDGSGSSMQRVARYLHEIRTGRTSSVSTRLLGFDDRGEVVNYQLPSPLDEAQIFLKSTKVIALVDLGGHERYLRTTLRGVMSKVPDYAMLVVGANAGLLRMGREHLGICVVLGIPFFSVITKVDMVSDHVLERTLDELIRILKMPGINKLPLVVEGRDDIVVAARHVQSGRVVPIFRVSNVDGRGIGDLLTFLNLLPPRTKWDSRRGRPLLMYVDDKFNVRGVGPVIAGVVLEGVVGVDDRLLIGPFEDGSWRQVRVKSIHINRVPASRALAGQEATLAVAGVEYDELEKGMVVIGGDRRPRSVREFRARLTILRHPTTIRRGYQAVLHLRAIRSPVSFEWMEREPMRTGDTGEVRLRFLYHPWYLQEGDVFVLREARTRAIGRVLELL